MPVNLELKARYESANDAQACALSCGGRPAALLHQRDTYFRVPRGRLKLRETQGEGAELIYYERADQRAERWSQFTRENVTEPAGLLHVLSEAFGVLAVVSKRRTLYMFRDARIHVDEVDDLGTFVEFEVTGGETPATLETMRHLRQVFAISDENIVGGSYSDMILAKRISAGS